MDRAKTTTRCRLIADDGELIRLDAFGFDPITVLFSEWYD